MEYCEKYSVSKANHKYNKSRSYIYFWKTRYNGSIAPLAGLSSIHFYISVSNMFDNPTPFRMP